MCGIFSEGAQQTESVASTENIGWGKEPMTGMYHSLQKAVYLYSNILYLRTNAEF